MLVTTEYSKEWSEARRARLERQLAQQEYEKVLMNLDQQSSLNNDLIDEAIKPMCYYMNSQNDWNLIGDCNASNLIESSDIFASQFYEFPILFSSRFPASIGIFIFAPRLVLCQYFGRSTTC